jgi:hypothetical protein
MGKEGRKVTPTIGVADCQTLGYFSSRICSDLLAVIQEFCLVAYFSWNP